MKRCCHGHGGRCDKTDISPKMRKTTAVYSDAPLVMSVCSDVSRIRPGYCPHEQIPNPLYGNIFRTSMQRLDNSILVLDKEINQKHEFTSYLPYTFAWRDLVYRATKRVPKANMSGGDANEPEYIIHVEQPMVEQAMDRSINEPVPADGTSADGTSADGTSADGTSGLENNGMFDESVCRDTSPVTQYTAELFYDEHTYTITFTDMQVILQYVQECIETAIGGDLSVAQLITEYDITKDAFMPITDKDARESRTEGRILMPIQCKDAAWCRGMNNHSFWFRSSEIVRRPDLFALQLATRERFKTFMYYVGYDLYVSEHTKRGDRYNIVFNAFHDYINLNIAQTKSRNSLLQLTNPEKFLKELHVEKIKDSSVFGQDWPFSPEESIWRRFHSDNATFIYDYFLKLVSHVSDSSGDSSGSVILNRWGDFIDAHFRAWSY
jgi:hypothetical protein